MAESFLEEQLKRIRDMSEQVSKIRGRFAEVSREIERGSRRHGPLQVRDVRTFSSQSETENEPDDDPTTGRRPPPRTTRRRR